MALLLIDPDYDFLLDLCAPAGVLESVHEQWVRLAHDPEREEFTARISARLLPVLSDRLDWDLKPPLPHKNANPTLGLKRTRSRLKPPKSA